MGWFIKFITFGWARAICIAPFGIYYKRYSLTTINHEKIHWRQQTEMLIVPFYVWYFVEWLIKLFIYGDKAYLSISFRREAYDNDNNVSYLITRKRFSWIKRVIK